MVQFDASVSCTFLGLTVPICSNGILRTVFTRSGELSINWAEELPVNNNPIKQAKNIVLIAYVFVFFIFQIDIDLYNPLFLIQGSFLRIHKFL
jgi:hypothetical protein